MSIRKIWKRVHCLFCQHVFVFKSLVLFLPQKLVEIECQKCGRTLVVPNLVDKR